MPEQQNSPFARMRAEQWSPSARMRAEQQGSPFARMKAEQWASSAEEEALKEDWLSNTAGIVGLATAIPLGITTAAGIAAGIAMAGVTYATEHMSNYLSEIAEEVHPSLRLPTYIGANVLAIYSYEKWLYANTIKAATINIPKFWSKEFTLASQKGVLSKQFVEDSANIIARMDMGEAKATDEMLNLFRQEAFQEKMIKTGEHLEKLKKGVKTPEPAESVEKVITQLKKKKFLDTNDYQRLAKVAKEDAVKDYSATFNKVRTNSVNRAANDSWQSHKMKDVIDAVAEGGGVSPKYKFASPELEKLFSGRHPNLKATTTTTAKLEKIAGDFGYSNIDDMMQEVCHTQNQKMFRLQASAELTPEFNRVYRDEILVRIAEREADYLFKLHGVSRGFKEGKILKQQHVAALHRASNTLPARLVIKEVGALKTATTRLLKIIQKPDIGKEKLLRLSKIYDQKLMEYQTAVKIKRDLGLINQRLKKASTVSGEYQEQLQKLLAPLFNRTSKKVDKHMFAFLADKYRDEVSIGADVLIKRYDGLLKNFPFSKRNFMDLTHTQAKDLDEFVKVFKFVAQNDKYIYDKANKMLLKVVAKEIHKTAATAIPKIKFLRPRIVGTQLEELAARQGGKILNAQRSTADVAEGFLASLKRIEAICYQLDGFKTSGRAWTHIFNKTIMAEVAEQRFGRRVFGAYEKIFAAHKAATKTKPSKYWSATSGNLAGHPIRKESAVVMALNSKNTGNMKAMLKGLGISRDTLIAFLDKALTEADWKLVNDTFDFLDELFPVIAKVYKQKTGLTLPKAVGGRYFPILADRKYAKMSETIDDLFVDPSTELFQAKVVETFTEFRHGGVKAVRLSLNGLTQHLSDVVHYTTHWGPLNEIQRLTRDQTFKTAVETTMGKNIYAQFDPWLKNLAHPSRTKIDNFMGKARRNVTFANLALIPQIAVKQSLSFITAMPKVGYTNAMLSLNEFMRNPKAILEAIKEASPEMAYRSKIWNRDLIELQAEINPTSAKGALLKVGYAMIHMVDEITSAIIWNGGYKKGLTKHSGHGDLAVRNANRAVRGTQPASAAKDIPLIMRSGEILRGLTMFYSYWSVYHGQVAEVISKGLAKHITPAQVAGTLAWLTIAPAIAQHLSRAAWNTLTGREQEEEHAKEIARGAALNMVAGLPVARDISTSILKGYAYQASPLMTIPTEAVDVGNAIGKIFDEDQDFNQWDVTSAVKLGSYLRLYPSRAMITAVTGGLGIYEGETDDWTEVFEKPAFKK